jgi:hypothetical protein
MTELETEVGEAGLLSVCCGDVLMELESDVGDTTTPC